jgi:hypothetical protein
MILKAFPVVDGVHRHQGRILKDARPVIVAIVENDTALLPVVKKGSSESVALSTSLAQNFEHTTYEVCHFGSLVTMLLPNIKNSIIVSALQRPQEKLHPMLKLANLETGVQAPI